MARQAAGGVFGLVLLAAVLDSTGRGQPPAGPDRVFYRDKKDNVVRNFEGTLKATPAGYLFTPKDGKDVLLSPADIVSVVPGGAAPGVERSAFDEVVKQDNNREWAKVLPQYEQYKKVSGLPEKFRRFADYRAATAHAKLADATADDAGWKDRAADATKHLTDYLTAYPNGWEQWPASRAAARLQGEQGQFQEAARTWGRLVKAADLPPDLRQEAAYQEAEALVRAKRYPDAAGRAADALKAAPAGAAKDRLALVERAARAADAPLDGVAQIEAEVTKTKDPAARAAGQAMIAELYLIANRPRDAMWALLWVEVVYNQDRDEVAKALARLADVMQAQGDADRAAAYRTKLRQFRGGL